METMYKVGDVVRIRDDLVPDILYPTECSQATKLYFVEEMLQYRGMEVTITERFHVLGGRAVAYNIAEDEDGWLWCADMFEGLAGDNQDMSVDLGCLIGG